jgi:trehalose 6-phosphate synthase/phosphatase
MSHPDSLDFDKKDTVLAQFQNAAHRLILLDYDGTLSDFKPHPELASPEAMVLELLKELSQNPKNALAIVSGRDRNTLEQWFGELPITLIAEHGTFVRKDGFWKSTITDPIFWKRGVLKIMKTFAENCTGAFVEEKSFSLCWHYRNANKESGFAQSRELISILSDYLISTNANIIDGNKVIEVKPVQINKGTAILNAFTPADYGFCLCIGDDTTDEDMFEVVNQFEGITIKVGKSSSMAKYRLETIQMVVSFLGHLNQLQHERKSS